MSAFTWWRPRDARCTPARQRRSPSARRAPFRPRLELLEGRVQPSTGPFNDGVNDGDGEFVLLDGGGFYRAVAIQTINGVEKIVVGGTTPDIAHTDDLSGRLMVARYDPTGNLDPSFDGDGIATLHVPGHSTSGHSLVTQPDGKVVLVGSIFNYGASEGTRSFDVLVARFTPAGALDPTFGGGDGWAQFGVARKSYEDVRNVGLQATGKIVVAGQTSSTNWPDSLLARFRADGTLDSGPGGFGPRDRKGVAPGYTIADVLPRNTDAFWSMLVRPDGRLVVSGHDSGTAFLAQYTADGVLDRTFNPYGPQPGFVFLQDVGLPGGGISALQPDGKIILTAGTGNNILVARFHADGTLDVGFGGGTGYVLTDGYHSASAPASAVVQPDGKIVVVGRVHDSQVNEQIVVARLHPDGALDTAFGNNGYKLGQPASPGLSMLPRGLARLSDGSLFVVGYVSDGQTDTPWIMRFTSDSVAPQLAAGGQGPGGAGVFSITSDQVAALLPAAIDRWADAGLSDADLARLHAVRVQVVDLPAGYLGAAPLFGDVISLDHNAAGYGWFIDVSPWDDAEFADPLSSPAFGRMDLLTVVMHELGHLIGRDSVFGGDPSDLMAAYLGTGIRRLPTATEAADIPSADAEAEPIRLAPHRRSVGGAAVAWVWDGGPRRKSQLADWLADAAAEVS